MPDLTVSFIVYGFVGLILVSGFIYLVPEYMKSRKDNARRKAAEELQREKEQV